ncbi:DnaJ domain-containing protein, partial [Zopfochytrium polystomum]
MPGEGSRGCRHRSLSLFAAALALFVLVGWCAAAVRAWEQADYEIFDLLKGEKDEDGNKVDFYNVLGVTPKSSSAEITKAYRKASLALHPDKNPEKDTSALYALLTSINAILKDADSRERYDRHLARGIPRWRGTGYFIARYKPGVTFISTFVVVAISFTQYLTSWILY